MKPNTWKAFYLGDYQNGNIASTTYWEIRFVTKFPMKLEYLDKENFDKFQRGLPYFPEFKEEVGTQNLIYIDFRRSGGSFFVLKNNNSVQEAMLHWQGASFFDGSNIPDSNPKLQRTSFKQYTKSFTVYNEGNQPIPIDAIPIREEWELKKCVNEPVNKTIVSPQNYAIASSKPLNDPLEQVAYQRVFTGFQSTQPLLFIVLDEENLAKFLKNEPYEPIKMKDKVPAGVHSVHGRKRPLIYFITVNKYSTSLETLLMYRNYVI